MMKKQFIIISVFVFSLLFPVCCGAKVFGKEDKKNEVDIYELSIDENISTPELGKHADKIVEFQAIQCQILKSLNKEKYPYEIKLIRNGEVIMITIPARSLFNQNDSILAEVGKVILKPLLKYMSSQQYYKTVLAMHSDNTGNEIYTMNLTTKRVNSVFDWLDSENNVQTANVVPYALGSNDPIVDNNSVSNRDKNRRLVIYLIPDKAMINQLKKGKINL